MDSYLIVNRLTHIKDSLEYNEISLEETIQELEDLISDIEDEDDSFTSFDEGDSGDW